jgi:hypothetical protein
MASPPLLRLYIETWNTLEPSSNDRVRLMSARVKLMTQKTPLYGRGESPPHLPVDPRLAQEEAQRAAGPLARTGVSFRILMTCTPLWAPRLTGRVGNTQSAIVLLLPCYQSYRMHSLPLVNAARGRFPPHLEAPHQFCIEVRSAPVSMSCMHTFHTPNRIH